MKDSFEADAERFSAFLVANYPPARGWPDPVGCCRWYVGLGFMAVAIGENGEIVAMWAARPVERPGLGVLPFYYNQRGKCLHVDLLIDTGRDKRAKAALWSLMLVRFGELETISMFRRTEEKLHVYPLKRFGEVLLRTDKIKKRKEHYGETIHAIRA